MLSFGIRNVVVVILSLIFSIKGFAKGRALVVISELDHRGVEELAPIYKQLELMAWTVPSKLTSIKSVYEQKILVRNQEATSLGVQEALIRVLADPKINTVDVILGVHGLPGKIAFYDGSIKVTEWAGSLKEKVESSLGDKFLEKLGLMYNLSCFGESHNAALLDLGFKVVAGSRQVNANAEVEYPFVLELLSKGVSVGMAFSIPNSESWLNFADGPIRWLGEKQNNFMKETDSFKVISGDSNYRILD